MPIDRVPVRRQQEVLRSADAVRASGRGGGVPGGLARYGPLWFGVGSTLALTVADESTGHRRIHVGWGVETDGHPDQLERTRAERRVGCSGGYVARTTRRHDGRGHQCRRRSRSEDAGAGRHRHRRQVPNCGRCHRDPAADRASRRARPAVARTGRCPSREWRCPQPALP